MLAALSMLTGIRLTASPLAEVGKTQVAVRQQRLQAKLGGNRRGCLDHTAGKVEIGRTSFLDHGQDPAGMGLGSAFTVLFRSFNRLCGNGKGLFQLPGQQTGFG
jgi:hypothetical protein